MKKRGKKAKKEKAENEAENGRKGKNVRYTPSGVLRRVILIFAALYGDIHCSRTAEIPAGSPEVSWGYRGSGEAQYE